jgi:hypothetical protein
VCDVAIPPTILATISRSFNRLRDEVYAVLHEGSVQSWAAQPP